jgi:hypothetical protein
MNAYRTSELDLLYSQEGIWVVLGPNGADEAELVNAFDRIAAKGPQNRVGLFPSRSTHKWRFVEQPGKTFVLPPCPVACTSLDEVVTNAVKLRPDVPVAAWRCGDYLCIYTDHGVGDGRYIARLVAALTNPEALASFESDDEKVSRHPFALALWTGLRSQPRQLAQDVANIVGLVTDRLRAAVNARGQRPTQSARTSDAPKPASEEVRCVWVSSGRDYLNSLRAYRDASHPGVSTTVLTMYSILKSVELMVDELSSEVEILTDMRRFLPAGRTTHGNFATVVLVPFERRDAPEDFSAQLTARIGSYVPLVKLLGGIAISRLRYSFPPRRRPRFGELPKPASDPRTKVTFIDWSKFPANARVSWPDPKRAELVGITPPATRQHIVMVLTSPGDDRVQVTARFYESHIHADAVRAILTRALSVEFLRELEGTLVTKEDGA